MGGSKAEIMPAPADEAAAHEQIDWILRQATAGDDLGPLMSELCRRLCADGVPLWRANLGMPTIDPTFRGVAVNWWRDRPAEVTLMRHGAAGAANFERSPVAYLQTRGLTEHRWRLESEPEPDLPETLQEMRLQGATDYRLHLTGFSGEIAIRGVAISFATDRPGGFEKSELAFLARMVPALGLASYRFAIARLAREMLSIYLGPRTGRRVLSGDIRRGEGQTIEAAILFADLRGFTAMTEREDDFAVVGWVDEHLEAVVDPVADRGGEILKFLGDGVLAVFPAGEGEALPGDACDRALAAAEDALARTAALNRRRAASGAPMLALDVVLHYGNVVYGNVGAPRRLDFTVIGRAVNEASRMEALCDTLQRHLLASSTFAGHCSRVMTSLGSFALRGIEGLRDIYVPSIVSEASDSPPPMPAEEPTR